MKLKLIALLSAAVILNSCDLLGTLQGANESPVPPPEKPTISGDGIETPVVADVGFTNGSEGVLSITFADNGGRSIAGTDFNDIKDVTIRNTRQMILIDDAVPGQIWDYDEYSDSHQTLSCKIRKNHTYHVLLLMGYKNTSDESVLLASGYLKHIMLTNSETLTIPLTALLADVSFVKNASQTEVIEPGRLGITVGLEALASYTYHVGIGSTQNGKNAPDDAKKIINGDGLAPLKNAEAGVKGNAHWSGTVTLVSNIATIRGTDYTDYNDISGTGNATSGTADYMFIAPAAGVSGTAVFKMQYKPFGLADAAWSDSAASSATPLAAARNTAPLWIIRNGFNDDEKNGYDVTTSYPGGAITITGRSVSSLPSGMYEDANKEAIAVSGFTAGTNQEDDLQNALAHIDSNAARAKYGTYTIRLGDVKPALPTGKIYLGGSGVTGDWSYANVSRLTIVIESTGDIVLPAEENLFVLSNGVSVLYGEGVGVTSITTGES
jgi:hypothetical protein